MTNLRAEAAAMRAWIGEHAVRQGDLPAGSMVVDAEELDAFLANRPAPPEPAHDHSGCSHGEHTCPVCHARPAPPSEGLREYAACERTHATGTTHYHPLRVKVAIDKWEDARPAPPSEGLNVRRVVKAIENVAARHGIKKDPPMRLELARIYGYSTTPEDMDAQIAREYAALSASTEPSAEHDHSGCAHGDHTCPVCHASTEPSADNA